MEEDSKRGEGELETRVLEKVGEVIAAVKKAKHVDQVICSLHSIASLLFHIDSSLLSGQSQASFSTPKIYLKFSVCKLVVQLSRNIGQD